LQANQLPHPEPGAECPNQVRPDPPCSRHRMWLQANRLPLPDTRPGEAPVWAANRICPVAAIPECPLTATSSHCVIIGAAG
jgi:hypothetical protein